MANSIHTKSEFAKRFGVHCHVCPPLVLPLQYWTETDRTRVVYINPNPMKGVDLVLTLAERRQDIPFDVVESWTLPDHITAASKARALALPNVRWLKPRQDMRTVYRHARILLAPSSVGHPEWVEAWGRVATEAQISGIPVLASDSGGLPEAVGPGGIIVSRDAPLDAWLSALSQLWDDPLAYAGYCERAVEHSHRAEVDPSIQMDRLLSFLDHIFVPPVVAERPSAPLAP